MKYWFFMLLWPMLFIDTIAICSWDTYTTYMLVIIHKRKLEKINNPYKQLERNEKKCNKCKGKNLNIAIYYTICIDLLMNCCYPSYQVNSYVICNVDYVMA
jgi:hypothetical protein